MLRLAVKTSHSKSILWSPSSSPGHPRVDWPVLTPEKRGVGQLTLKVKQDSKYRLSVAKTTLRHANLQCHHTLRSVLEKKILLFSRRALVWTVCVYQAHHTFLHRALFQIRYVGYRLSGKKGGSKTTDPKRATSTRPYQYHTQRLTGCANSTSASNCRN